MNILFRYAATIVFVLIALGSGLLHGFRTYRWDHKPSLDEYVNRLQSVPTSFGDWTSEINRGADEVVRNGIEVVNNPVTGRPELRYIDNLKTHGIEDYILRIYRNKRSTETYSVLVVCGRPGPIASHTPDVCYRGSGYTQNGDQSRGDVTVTEEGAANRGQRYPLNFLKFRPPITRLESRELQIRWAWLPPSGKLSTPGSPRIEFASQPALYKVYVIHEPPTMLSPTQQPASSRTDSPLPSPTTFTAQDPSKFLLDFLPRLEAALKDPVSK
ncbi:hypothetical protein BH11PLA2_BH11PLA2_13340 [soil metagenome]